MGPCSDSTHTSREVGREDHLPGNIWMEPKSLRCLSSLICCLKGLLHQRLLPKRCRYNQRTSKNTQSAGRTRLPPALLRELCIPFCDLVWEPETRHAVFPWISELPNGTSSHRALLLVKEAQTHGLLQPSTCTCQPNCDWTKNTNKFATDTPDARSCLRCFLNQVRPLNNISILETSNHCQTMWQTKINKEGNNNHLATSWSVIRFSS